MNEIEHPSTDCCPAARGLKMLGAILLPLSLVGVALWWADRAEPRAHAATSVMTSGASTDSGTSATATPTTHPIAIVPASPVAGINAVDVEGMIHPLADTTAKAIGLVFLNTECPICSSYAPQLSRLATEQAKAGVLIYGIISDPTVTRAAAAAYEKSYKITFPLLFDASGELAKALKPGTTPEAFVLDKRGQVRYHGRIDDAWADLFKPRLNVTHHEFTDALAAVAAGRAPEVMKTDPVGCVFEAWERHSSQSQVTFCRDIAPIVNANCVTCHRPGEVAPFALTSYEEAAKHAKQIARVTDERVMPPWKAEPNFGHFRDERRLTPTEMTLIGTWAATGAPRGDSADLPPLPKFPSDWALGQPDMVLTMPKPFTVPASGRDIYRCFVLPMNIPDDRYVTAVEFRPDAKTVVHHALFFLDNSGKAAGLAAANTDGQPGYRSFGGIGFAPSGGLGGWAPGVEPSFLPDGVGQAVRRGANGVDLLLQVHYHPDGKEHTDQSRIGLYFAKKPVTRIAISIPIQTSNIDIPAGESHYVRAKSIILPTDVTVIGMFPHMHLIGKEMKVTATLPDGTVEPLIWIRDWQFQWQNQYHYVDPIILPKGTRVDVEAIYDNSENNPDNPNTPPKRVRHGEQTTDEMCICFAQILVPNGPGLQGLRQALRQRFLHPNDTSAKAPS